MKIVTKNAQETAVLGYEFAKKLKGGEILALVGDLGSGKTTFVQGLAKGLGIKKRVISPTFMLMRRYDIKIKNQKSKMQSFYHVDLYRLEENLGQEIKNLGLTDIWGKLENIVVIEWAEKIKNLLPEKTIWMKFIVVDGDVRRIIY